MHPRSPRTTSTALLGIVLAIAAASMTMTQKPQAQTPPSSASACASCHRAQTINQPNTPMGRASILLSQNTTLKTHPKMTVQRGPYTYTVESHDDQATYSVTDGKRTVSYPIHWSFGNGVQAWLLERDGKIYESLVSYYPETDSLNLTIGDEALKPQNLEEAAARELTTKVVKDCFGCHSTNAVLNGKLSLQTAEPGVTCEHCHQGASAHMIAASQGQFDVPPPSLSKLSSEDLSNFCGQCHRSWETVIRNGWKGPANVRFAPYRLSSSRCFDGSDPRIVASPVTTPIRTSSATTPITTPNASPATIPPPTRPPPQRFWAQNNAPSPKKIASVATCRNPSCRMKMSPSPTIGSASSTPAIPIPTRNTYIATISRPPRSQSMPPPRPATSREPPASQTFGLQR